MRIIEVAYGRTFNTGNYTSERYDLKASVDPGESHDAVILDLMERVFLMGGDKIGAAKARALRVQIEEKAVADGRS